MPQQYLSTDPNAGEPIQQPQQGGGLADLAAQALPTVGGLVGGLTGGIGGATVGGMAGQGYGELLKHAGEIPGAVADVARNVFTQPRATFQGFLRGANEGAVNAGIKGATEGGGQALGGAVGKGVTMLGKGVYKGGMSLVPRTLKRDYATQAMSGGRRLADAGFKEGIPLTERGAAKAGRVMDDVSGKLDQKLAAMDRIGAKPITMDEVVGPIQGTMTKIGKEGRRAAKLSEADEIRSQYLIENPTPMSLVRTNELKRAEQKLATDAYKRQAAGHPINAVEMNVQKDVASGARAALEDRAPSVAADNDRLQALIGLQQAADYASSTAHAVPRGLGAIGLGALGGYSGGMIPAALSALTGAALTTPGGLTSTGLLLKGAAPVAEHGSARLAALLAQLAAEQ